MKRRAQTLIALVVLCLAAGADGSRLSFQEHAAVQESLARVHPRMRASWLRGRGLDDSYYTTFHRPESTSGLSCVGRWPWGPSWELAGKDTFLYLGSGSGVRILSMADSVHPRMLGQINARSLVSQVVVQDSLLFVACGSWGAQIYSVANPANPRELGSMDAVIGDLAVEDTFCYTAGDSFRIYNFAHPSLPTQVGAVGDSGDVIVESNGYAYVGHGSSGSGLNVYDARNPHAPELVNTLGGVQLAMFTRGHWLFRISEQPAYFSMLDISNPASPSEVGRLNGYGGIAMYADDKYAYFSASYEHSGLFIVDISDSSHPQLRDSIDPEGLNEWDPFVPRSPGYGYLADDYGGLITLDLHDVNDISQAWSGHKACRSIDIDVDNDRAYVANDQSGLQIVDVTDPTSPNSLGIYDIEGAKTTTTVQVQDSFAFIGFWGSNRRFLRVLDVTNPASPTFAAEESCFNPLEDIVLRDSFVYAAEPYKFEVFNVARPREPVLVGSCSGDGVAVVVQDSFAYTGAGAIRVTNVARPDSPFVVTTIYRASSDLCILDSILVCDPGPAIWYSLANPAVPVPIDSLDMGHWIVGMAAVNRTIYLCSGPSYTTLYAISIADLHQPRVIDQASLPYTVKRITYAAPYLYLSCWDAGVFIYETTSAGIGEQPVAPMQPTGLRVWPNVTSDKVRFEFGAGMRATGVAVFDISGKRLRDVTLRNEAKGGAEEGSIDLTGLSAGVYVVKAESEGTSFTAKVVKTSRR